MRRRVLIALDALVPVVALGLRFSLSPAAAQPTDTRGFRLRSGLLGAARALTAARVEAIERAQAEARRESAQKARVREQILPMPDLTQTDPALGVVGGGEAWCGPVAMSNALAWLGANGREMLLPAGEDARSRQLELVRRLGSNRYMGTTPNGGTGTANLLKGLHAFLRDSGYGYRRLQYQGWRGHPARFSTGIKSAELSFLKKALDDGGVAIIHAGWYTPSKYGDFYRRHGGHWLTVVGAGFDENGASRDDTFVVHDPAPYAGPEGAEHFVTLTRMEGGWLMAEDGAFPARGFRRLEGGMKIKVPGDVAVLDGAVALVP